MNRTEILERLKTTDEFDFVIIGGGATGLGCALDAASRGFKTLLLEKYDFAKGTSSRATKLVHGGVRYLAQGNVRLVREALLERGRLLKNAPHVCHILPFVLPVYSSWQKIYYGIGLNIYEFLSGKLSLGKTKLLSKNEVLNFLPDINNHQLKGGILYFDGQFDDSRLAISLAHTAFQQGALVLNYFGVNNFIKKENKIIGVKATDEVTGINYEIKAKVVINATGVFADEILQLAEGNSEKTIAPSQGIHLVLDKHFFTGNYGMMIPKTEDGRVLFIIPWHEKLLIGTTDTPVENISLEPAPLEEEIDFIIHHFNKYANKIISRKEVQTVYVGLRPLAINKSKKKTSVMPRDHVIKILPSGLIHVTGGKWTTYRNMAEQTINKAIKNFGLKNVDCKTKNLKIIDNQNNNLDNDTSQKIHPNYAYTKAQIKWMIENEMVVNAEDILARRIRLLFLDARAAIEAAPTVVKLMAEQNNKDENWQQNQLEQFINLAKNYLIH